MVPWRGMNAPQNHNLFQHGKVQASVSSLVLEAKKQQQQQKPETQVGSQFVSVLRSYCKP